MDLRYSATFAVGAETVPCWNAGREVYGATGRRDKQTPSATRSVTERNPYAEFPPLLSFVFVCLCDHRSCFTAIRRVLYRSLLATLARGGG